MQDAITLILQPDVKLALENTLRCEGISADDLVNDALRKYLFVRQFRTLRERMVAQAQMQGIDSDEDVFSLSSTH